MYIYPAVDTHNLDLKDFKKITKKTKLDLKSLDPNGKIEKWWDRQVSELAQHFSKTYPEAQLDDWNEYLDHFIRDALQHKTEQEEDPLSLSTSLSSKDQHKVKYLATVLAILNEKTAKQFSSIEKVKANWRFDHNQTRAENLIRYFSNPEFLVQLSTTTDAKDITTRSCDNLNHFLGTANLAEIYSLPSIASKSLAKLVAGWPTLYKNFMEKAGANADFDEAINSKEFLTADILDPKGEFRQWWKIYGTELNAIFHTSNDKTQPNNMQAFLNALYSKNPDKNFIYLPPTSIALKSSYLAAFFQFFLAPIFGTARYNELDKIAHKDLTAKQLKEIEEYALRSTYFLKITNLFQQESLGSEPLLYPQETAYSRPTSPVTDSISIDTFSLSETSSISDQDSVSENNISSRAASLHESISSEGDSSTSSLHSISIDTFSLSETSSISDQDSVSENNFSSRPASLHESISSEVPSISDSSTLSLRSADEAIVRKNPVTLTPSNLPNNISSRNAVIDQALENFQFIVFAKADPESSTEVQIGALKSWTEVQIRAFHQELFKVMMPSQKFQIQEMIDQFQQKPENKKLYEHYSEFQNDLYLRLMEGFMQKIYEELKVPVSTKNPLKTTLYEVYTQFSAALKQSITTSHQQEKSTFLNTVNAIFVNASKNSLAKAVNKHFKIMDLLSKAELNLINTFYHYRKTQVRSPAEYASFKEAYMDEITTDTKKALQLEKPCIEKIGKAAVTFQDSKSKLGAAFDVAQKSTASLLKSLASIPISVEVSKENITSQEVNVKKSFFSRLRM